jgi:hypothetical protein
MAEQNAATMLKQGDQPRATAKDTEMARAAPSLSYNRQPLRSTNQRFSNVRNYSR